MERLFAEVRPSHLLHLAWVTKPGEYWGSPENLDWVAASLHMVRSFGEHGGRRAVLVGSCAEYEWARESVCNEVTTPCRPATVYGVCKNALRAVMEAFARQTNLSTAWARLFFLYGPGEHPARLVASAIRAVLAGERARCTAGDRRRDFLHVWDAADALVRLLGTEITGPINVASGEPVAVAAVVRTVAGLLGRPDLVDVKAVLDRQGEPALLAADVTRLASDLHWAPHFPLRAGLEHTINWWKAAAAAGAAR